MSTEKLREKGKERERIRGRYYAYDKERERENQRQILCIYIQRKNIKNKKIKA